MRACILLLDGEPRYLQWFDRLDVDRGAGIGCHLEGGFQESVRDFVIGQEYIKPGERHTGQFEFQQGVFLVEESGEIVHGNMEITGKSRCQGFDCWHRRTCPYPASRPATACRAAATHGNYS